MTNKMKKEKLEKFLISIVAWLLLIGGAASVLLSVFTISIENLLQSVYYFVIGIFLIKASSGIRQMRRWTLFVITALFFWHLYNILRFPLELTLREVFLLVFLAVELIAIPYFWSIYRKFK